jgi:hypothetical protein
MKLRLHNNSVRLRLSQADVARLRDTGMVEDVVRFPSGSELRYTVETDPVLAVLTATFNNANIRIGIPSLIATKWIESDETGIEESGVLGVLVEKDFQCLHREPQPGEDAFPNPMA